MSTNLIPIKTFLGKYYSEILYSADQDKYKNTGLDKFFEQRFQIQNNKAQMIVDPAMSGLGMVVTGNEIQISKELYDHPNVVISNSLENTSSQNTNPRSLYNPETVQTLAYLICPNQTTLTIVGDLDEPIYVKYRSDFETFYNSVLTFEINDEVVVEIVEEIESNCALNSVTNYVLHAFSKLSLTSFYQNNVAGISFLYRNVFARERSAFNHIVFGKGSSCVIDETKVRCASGSNTEMMGIINSNSRNFHSILYVEPAAQDYKIVVDYRDVLYDKANVTFYPAILGQQPSSNGAEIEVSNICLDDIPKDNQEEEIKQFLSPIVDRAILERMMGVKRFYDNKSKFLHFP